MAGRAVNISRGNVTDTQLEQIAKWLSCNGEVWGVGPTIVFASAAALFLYQELIAAMFVDGDQPHISLLEKTLLTTMLLGMLALMVHLWVCTTRFFLYYLDTLIRDSPNMLLEMTTASLLGGQSEMVAIGPLTKFLKQQQPQIHITVCWFLSLCYADYVRKNYCTRFNMPYLEQWQEELHARASRGVARTMQKVNSFVGAVHQRLRGFTEPTPTASEAHTVRARRREQTSAATLARSCGAAQGAGEGATRRSAAKSCACAWSASPATRRRTPLRNLGRLLRLQSALAVHLSRGSLALSHAAPSRVPVGLTRYLTCAPM